ncbi:hypothetical protein QBC34DRAFT_390908 [Podospora aff. communis PSN243]|uniref:Uncharacterized protein n=1 Tax=Podospora aff. communis PSN243 TaxID=3040156 RepID=A0AAV9H2K9_9PEZI|nr:hypothetical protein QBC34DRAFT_390908 [Podospora aff. communis PSN243]
MPAQRIRWSIKRCVKVLHFHSQSKPDVLSSVWPPKSRTRLINNVKMSENHCVPSSTDRTPKRDPERRIAELQTMSVAPEVGGGAVGTARRLARPPGRSSRIKPLLLPFGNMNRQMASAGEKYPGHHHSPCSSRHWKADTPTVMEGHDGNGAPGPHFPHFQMVEQHQASLNRSDGQLSNEDAGEVLGGSDAAATPTSTPVPRRKVKNVRTAKAAIAITGSVVKSGCDLNKGPQQDIEVSDIFATDDSLQIHGNVIGFSLHELRGNGRSQHKAW